MENAADNYYPGRAAALENFCYLNVLIRFTTGEKSTRADDGGSDDEEVSWLLYW